MLIIDLPNDILNNIYFLLNYNEKLNFTFSVVLHNNIHGKKKFSNLYSYYVPQIILYKVYGNIHFLKNYFSSYNSIEDKMYQLQEISDLLFGLIENNKRFIKWDNEILRLKKNRSKTKINKIFWEKTLIELKSAKRFLLCGCTHICWRCFKKIPISEFKNLLGSEYISKCFIDNKYYPCKIIAVYNNHVTVRFNMDDKISEIAPCEIQVNTPFYMLYNQPVCWMDYKIWEKSVYVKNGFILNNAFNIPWGWVYHARKFAFTALALIY